MYLSNHATYFHSHRLPIARALISRGIKVSLFCGSKFNDETSIHSELRNENLDLNVNKHLSGSSNIFSIIFFILQFMKHIYKNKPDILHCVSMKAVLVGLLYNKYFGSINTVLAISGLGTIFTANNSNSTIFYARKFLVYWLLKFLIKKQKSLHFIVQNHEDKEFLLTRFNVNVSDITLIYGSGVDTKKFEVFQKRRKKKSVLLASRLLINKGVIEYLTAVPSLKKQFPDWEFFLAGENDLDSPAAFDVKELDSLINSSGCKYLGHVQDMPRLLSDISIFVLPSYREGFPKVLIEAAVSGCALVTTNVAGCREAVSNGSLGVLVSPKSTLDLEKGITLLIEDETMRQTISKRMQMYAIDKFCIEKVVDQHITIYESF